MQASARTASAKEAHYQPSTTVTTTLYDLIETIDNEVPPGEEGLVTAVVADLLNSRRIRFIGNPVGLDAEIS
jgi:hypothetical protein